VGRRATPSAHRAGARVARPGDGRARARAHGQAERRPARRHVAAPPSRRRCQQPGPTAAGAPAPSTLRRGGAHARRTRPPPAPRRTQGGARSTRDTDARATLSAPRTVRRAAVGAAAGSRDSLGTAPLRSRRRRRSEPVLEDREVSRHTCLTSPSRVGRDLSRVCDAGVPNVCQLPECLLGLGEGVGSAHVDPLPGHPPRVDRHARVEPFDEPPGLVGVVPLR